MCQFTPVQIRSIIREASQPGVTTKSIIQKHGLSDVQFYHWKQAIADLISPDDELVLLLLTTLEDVKCELEYLADSSDNQDKHLRESLSNVEATLATYYENRPLTTAQHPVTHKFPQKFSNTHHYVALFEEMNGLKNNKQHSPNPY